MSNAIFIATNSKQIEPFHCETYYQIRGQVIILEEKLNHKRVKRYSNL